MNPKVDAFFARTEQWHDELQQLRTFLLDCGLTEELKWGQPCYSLGKANISILGGFKDYCVLNFVKGALIKDTQKILVQQTKNSQSVRILKFTSVKEIMDLESVIKAYIFEAIELEKAGLKVAYKKTEDYDFPEELQTKFDADPGFKSAFDKLTPGRQRGYLLHFSGAKQSSTRTNRIESCVAKIMIGKGFQDCTCGLSKRMPRCDGSHKQIK
ncbi:MAG: YdeI/OmpD-associated family protein [Crocinitomicaceae bacterium]